MKCENLHNQIYDWNHTGDYDSVILYSFTFFGRAFRLNSRTASFITALFFCFSFAANAQQVVGSYYAADGNPEAVRSLPAEKLTHVLYAFLALCGDNEGASKTTLQALKTACADKEPYDSVIMNKAQTMAEFEAFEELKAVHPHLVILPSFGGWTLSKPFHGMAESDVNRKRFVDSAVALIERHPVFDGIDIDWEFPGGGGNSQPELSGADANREKQAFRMMMQELRKGLDTLSDKTGRTYQLTAAVSSNKSRINAIDWQQTVKYMDYVFAMTYDFAVGDGRAAHHTNLFSVNSNDSSAQKAISNLMTAGVPAEKLVLGVAFYGRGWIQSGWQGEQFSQNAKSKSIGSYVYKDLVSAPPKGYQQGYDSKAEAAYFYKPATGGFISYDNPRSVTAKAKWAKKMGLAGLFSWQIRQDNGSLLDAMHKGME